MVYGCDLQSRTVGGLFPDGAKTWSVGYQTFRTALCSIQPLVRFDTWLVLWSKWPKREVDYSDLYTAELRRREASSPPVCTTLQPPVVIKLPISPPPPVFREKFRGGVQTFLFSLGMYLKLGFANNNNNNNNNNNFSLAR